MAAEWQGRTVVVTGGSSGLGLAIATAFAARGARIVLIARHMPTLEQAAGPLRARGSAVLCVAADLTSSDDVQRAFGKIDHQEPSVDVLVNAAGRSARAGILETTEDDFQRLWDLNFLGTVRCTRAAADRLIESKGHLVNIGSLAAKTASRYLGAYPAGKFALAAYSQQLRLELGPRGMHVLLVCPGPIARDDAGCRYDNQAAGLPPSAGLPGGGAKLRAIDPLYLAGRIIRACEKRQPELVVPARARILFALSQLWPGLGDWVVGRNT